ncbi:hypothetical protein EPIR_3753 [Erwinia piriflorinigrans CFBP 5888]|uniref:Uncharacterized protein n=1 Tax=Erwinia piriflorinigrans CFBP 5888 TaxID=1161919 RepID=V5ZDH4_9GAMM|nr:hypothetical protein EPIR_3753 [Erwinia piriflorinigrans CFBP 5888]
MMHHAFYEVDKSKKPGGDGCHGFILLRFVVLARLKLNQFS